MALLVGQYTVQPNWPNLNYVFRLAKTNGEFIIIHTIVDILKGYYFLMYYLEAFSAMIF
jgi:hypothetical protein